MLSAQALRVEVAGRRLLGNVSLTLAEGECLCVVGESGSGKTTLLKTLQGLMPFCSGEIVHALTQDGVDQHLVPGQSFLGLRDVCWVMQNPIAALNPHQRVGEAIAEGLYRAKFNAAETSKRINQVLLDVGLDGEMHRRRTRQLSLGQAQRVCIARALVANPRVIFFDEPLSALDAVVQKQVAKVIAHIQSRRRLSYLFVTHDLGFAHAYADNILLLRQGVVEAYQPVDEFFNFPSCAYAKELIDAAVVLGTLDLPPPLPSVRWQQVAV